MLLNIDASLILPTVCLETYGDVNENIKERSR